jgi:riboflavin kinase / FMN adenylyltransferase
MSGAILLKYIVCTRRIVLPESWVLNLMHVIRGLANLKQLRGGCVVTIGNFDGVHRGHEVVIRNLALEGRRLGLPVVVMLFEPQPSEYFDSGRAPSRLTRLREKIVQLRKLPVDYILVQRFTSAFAGIEPEHFIRMFLVEGLKTRYLVVGDDFRFGKNRRGDFGVLQTAGAAANFVVDDTDTFRLDGHRVSSTSVRQALEAGNLAKAERLLGRPYSVCGRVIHGEKRGRSIGFPTANIRMFRKNTPVQGVFAVTMSGIGSHILHGVANVGTRPTIGGGQTVLLETHLFDFDQEIYNRYVEVHFVEKIRNEQRFESFDALKKQIRKDVEQARMILRTLEGGPRID